MTGWLPAIHITRKRRRERDKWAICYRRGGPAEKPREARRGGFDTGDESAETDSLPPVRKTEMFFFFIFTATTENVEEMMETVRRENAY